MDTIKFKSNEQVADELAGLLLAMEPGDMILVSRYEPSEKNGYKAFTLRKAEGGVVNE